MNGWRWVAGMLVLALPVAAGAQQSRAPENPLERFSFVVGTWSGTFKGYPTAAMPNAFESPATMTSRWGSERAWIESEAKTEIPGVGPYSAKVLVGCDGRSEMYAFVINTFRNAARYSGRIEGNRAVFVGTVGNVTQRVTYENVNSRELRFLVEESRDDGASYQPHSEILWRRE